MRSLNKVFLIGNLGKDPEYTENQNFKRASFPLATSEVYSDKNNNIVETTEWHNIVVWGRLAEIARTHLRKGSQIFVEGKIKTRSYEDQGVKKYITEIRADNLIMLGSRRDGTSIDTSDDVDVSETEQIVPSDFDNASFNLSEPVAGSEDDLPF